MLRRRKKRRTKGTRQFNGKRFTLGPHGSTKAEARKEAKKARKVGTKVRVAKVGKGKGLGLYTRTRARLCIYAILERTLLRRAPRMRNIIYLVFQTGNS